MKNPPLQQGHDGPRAPPLRPYQADTLQRMKSYEGNAALCVIATGLGKTRIFAEYISGTKNSAISGIDNPSPMSKLPLSTSWPRITKLTPIK